MKNQIISVSLLSITFLFSFFLRENESLGRYSPDEYAEFSAFHQVHLASLYSPREDLKAEFQPTTPIEEFGSKLPSGDWELIFRDEFDGTEEELDEMWHSQNGPSGHILSSRWRENAVLRDGFLRLEARKEDRAGQEWTAASLWTRRTFRYGYFECRYRYAGATGTNNSFWIMPRDVPADEPGRFEIDINEGHFPNKVNTNLHNWSGEHTMNPKHMTIEGANLAEEFHLYGLQWTENELIWYYDGKEIRREENTLCHSDAPVLLSLAIIDWAGPVTDAIDGTAMEVDFVRVYQHKKR